MAKLSFSRAELAKDLGYLLRLNALAAKQRIEFLAAGSHGNDLLSADFVFGRSNETAGLREENITRSLIKDSLGKRPLWRNDVTTICT